MDAIAEQPDECHEDPWQSDHSRVGEPRPRLGCDYVSRPGLGSKGQSEVPGHGSSVVAGDVLQPTPEQGATQKPANGAGPRQGAKGGATWQPVERPSKGQSAGGRPTKEKATGILGNQAVGSLTRTGAGTRARCRQAEEMAVAVTCLQGRRR
jgi:hypothetical protein